MGKLDSKALTDALYPITAKALANKKTNDDLFKGARKYFDKNANIIFDSSLAQRIFFTDSDKQVIYTASGLSIPEIRTVLKNAEYIKDNWKIMNEPLNTCAAMIARYYAINKKEKELKAFLTYYAFYFYTSVYHKYLPYGAQENIMAFTINNLSNKYLIKQTGSLFKTIEHTAWISHENHKDALIKGTDKGLADYISSLKVRINNFMKNIKNEYTQNHASKKYINYDIDSYDEDDFHVADNNSYIVQNTSDAAVVKLTTYGPDMKLVKLSANMNQVSENDIRNVISAISDGHTEEIKRMTELILQLYLFESHNTVKDIHSNKFLYSCIEIYKKSNTNDKIILEIKSILDSWLKKYSVRYNKTNREATLSSFRRAIYVYFVLHIQQSN